MKRFLSRILISTIPTLVALVVVGIAYAKYDRGEGGFTLGVDLVGGTILVYEVDDTKTKENFKAEDLAAALKRRIDPADLYNITIRPVPTTPPRVEIILPTGGQHQAEAERRNWDALTAEAAREFPVKGKDNPYGNIKKRDLAVLSDAIVKANPEQKDKVAAWVATKSKGEGETRRNLTGDDVERIKDLISKQGQLEFRILANRNDDDDAFRAAATTLKNTSKDDLERLAIRAEPPPAPRREDGGATFNVRLGDAEEDHTYSWVEIGKEQLHDLGFDTESLKSSGGKPNAQTVASALASGEPFPIGANLAYVRNIPSLGWSRRQAKDREKGKELEYFFLVRNAERGKEITGDYLTRANSSVGDKGPEINFTFNNAGGNLFYEVTTRNKPAGGMQRQLAIIFDGQIVSAPSLNEPIRTNGRISGSFTQAKVNEMVRIMKAGALPATLKKDPVSENSMGPTLGASTIKWGAISVGAAFLAILAFMIFYYHMAGIIACIALFSNLLLTVAFMVLVKAAFTLPGLAGLVLMLGMAVDANVLIYERLREERDRGASFALALRNGYDRAFPTILDTHLTSIFTAIVLYVVGNDQLKGFGISLTVGLIISLFTSLYMTRTIFEVLYAKGWLNNMTFFPGLVRLIHARYWDFMSIRKSMFAVTLVLTLLGAGLFIYRADSRPAEGKATVLNIDFTGGTAYTGRLKEPMTLESIQEKLRPSADKLPDLAVEQLFTGDGSPATSDRSEFFTVRTSNKDSKQVLGVISNSLQNELKQILLSDYTVKKDAAGLVTQVTVRFTSGDKPGFASQAQVSRLLGDTCQDLGLPRNLFAVDRPDDPEGTKEENDHFSELVLHLSDPTPAARIDTILKNVQEDFRQSPQPERLENFDQQLANNTQTRALYAILASWAAILLFLWFRFGSWTFGAAAVACLVHDLFFTLGAIAACHYIHGTFIGNLLGIGDFKIDLPSIAALLTLVGYSVSDTIVVFDRIREVRGKNPTLTYQMVNDSVNQTLTRTLLASATVFVVVLVLYMFGGEGVKLFAFIMIVGVLVGTYSSIYIASPLLLIFGEGKTAGPIDRAATPSSTAVSKA